MTTDNKAKGTDDVILTLIAYIIGFLLITASIFFYVAYRSDFQIGYFYVQLYYGFTAISLSGVAILTVILGHITRETVEYH